MSTLELQEKIYQWTSELIKFSFLTLMKTLFFFKDLKKHIENHMNPTKSKKQSSPRIIQAVKPETNYFHAYMHPITQFNQPNISDQQQMNQVP